VNANLIAHLRKKDKEPQPLWTHLEEVAEMMGKFANPIV